KRRMLAGQCEVRFMVGLDGSQVLPIAVEKVGMNPMGPNTARKDLFTEIRGSRRLVQKIEKGLPIEHIDAHAGEILTASVSNAPTLDPFGRHAHRLQLFFGFRLLDKADDAAGLVDLSDAETGSLLLTYRQNSDGDVGLIVAMGLP